VAGVIAVVGVLGLAGVWGPLACGLFAAPALVGLTSTGSAGLAYGGSFNRLGVQALGLLVVGAFTFSASFATLWLFDQLPGGIRVTEKTERVGLDLHEHGMWGYPEMYIPVPGGYGTEQRPVTVGKEYGVRPVPAVAKDT